MWWGPHGTERALVARAGPSAHFTSVFVCCRASFHVLIDRTVGILMSVTCHYGYVCEGFLGEMSFEWEAEKRRWSSAM